MNLSANSRSKKMSRLKDCYWRVVEDCLVEFHQLTRTDADERCAQLRLSLDNPPRGLMNSLYLHQEPFYMACDITGHQMETAPYRSQYDQILGRHNW